MIRYATMYSVPTSYVKGSNRVKPGYFCRWRGRETLHCIDRVSTIPNKFLLFEEDFKCSVSDYMKSVSWCRHRRAHNWNGEPSGSGKGNGEGRGEGGGGQFTSTLGPEWTGVAPHTKEGFQVSKRDPRTGEGFSRQRGNYQRGSSRGYRGDCVMCSNIMSILYILCYYVYVMLIKELCLCYK
jgi:hypothetical protein